MSGVGKNPFMGPICLLLGGQIEKQKKKKMIPGSSDLHIFFPKSNTIFLKTTEFQLIAIKWDFSCDFVEVTFPQTF